MMRSRVVFPLPDGPEDGDEGPSGHLEVDPDSTGTAPNDLATPVMDRLFTGDTIVPGAGPGA